MSIGTATKMFTVSQSDKKIVITGSPVWFRNLVTVSLTGHSGHTPENLVLLAYRHGELVALCDDFTGSDSLATGTLDLNTSELEAYFDGAQVGAIREVELYLYDADETSLDMLGEGKLKVYATRDYTDYVTPPVPPISATTLFIGSFAFYDGKTYLRNKDTGKYHEFVAAGATNATEAINNEGIDIPGSP